MTTVNHVHSDVQPGAVYRPGTELDYSEPAVAGETISDEVVEPRGPWSGFVRAGDVLTIVDVGGNQSADCLVFSKEDTDEKYSVPQTLSGQANVYLRTGSVLQSNLANPLMTVVLNEVDRQDTIGGACSKESNTLRYGHHTHNDHACRENFLAESRKYGLGPRDLVSNINWFMNVPVEDDGSLGIVDGMSGPGRRVALRAEQDVLVIVSNCPQMNNPCNDFNCTPLRMIITRPATS
ncbi:MULTISPECIES: urea amidolyase associated protein UAAP2 [Corynebacterium]|uniref:urea amidolyase associated protein UAAP2 n=1 Tax=Corynebacterium TaxID=1716 RepID=UPI00257BBA72|nr:MULTISPECIES: urea amidolyase associated protein UAAP2 [Corynebacterium]